MLVVLLVVLRVLLHVLHLIRAHRRLRWSALRGWTLRRHGVNGHPTCQVGTCVRRHA